MHNAGQLVRADSWELPGAARTQLIKTISNAQEHPFCSANCAPMQQGGQGLQGPSYCQPAAAHPGKPPVAPPQQTSISTTSTLTAAQHKMQPADAAPQPTLLPLPMRQVSLDAITASDLMCAREPSCLPDRSSIFNDVMDQLAAKEEGLPEQTGLYTIPDIQFLDVLLGELDSKTASSGHPPAEPPLYLPLDAFDFPEDSATHAAPLRPLGPSPFDLPLSHTQHQRQMQQQQQRNPQQQQQPHVVYHISAAATTQQPVAHPPPHHHHHHHGFIPTSSSMPMLAHAPSGFHGSSQIPPHSRSAGPSPAKPMRRVVSAYADYEYEGSEMSKGGRMRKVATLSYAGTKRKMSGDVLVSRGSLPDGLPSAPAPSHINNTTSESDTGADTLDDDSDDEVSKGSKASRKQGGGMKKGGKRTTCLNCGCHQTPQWRCGPLGPRTLCNACGVRYKKGLPLNCWPIREGMVLPPGAVLPPGVHIPGVILQPADDE